MSGTALVTDDVSWGVCTRSVGLTGEKVKARLVGDRFGTSGLAVTALAFTGDSGVRHIDSDGFFKGV